MGSAKVALGTANRELNRRWVNNTCAVIAINSIDIHHFYAKALLLFGTTKAPKSLLKLGWMMYRKFICTQKTVSQ
jgi:hypothetical protein